LYVAIAFLNRCTKSSEYTSDELRKPSNFIHSYKCLELLINEFNCLTKPYLFMAINNIMMVVSVGGQVISIQLRKKINPETLACLISLSGISMGYLILSYLKLGHVNENSKKCLGSWKRNAGLNLEYHDKFLALRYVRSLGACKVELGGFGYFKKANSLKIIEKIIYYIVKGIMLSQKFL